MKNFVVKYIPWLIILAMLALLVPGLVTRVTSEKNNNNVVMSVLYNDLRNKVSAPKVEEFFESCKKAGIDTVSIMEDDLNSLVARGEVTSIKYNILCHKYDDESMKVADAIEKSCPDVAYDSHIILVKKQESKEKLSYMIPRKFTSSTYACLKDVEGMDIYVLYNGRKELWDYAFGYDEEVIEEISSKGFNISLIYKVKNYDNLDYLEDMDRIIKKYNVEYLNLKEDTNSFDSKDVITKNYEGISKLIKDNNMTLVVTENTDQLSNQKFLGYSHVYNSVMSQDGTKKVIRSYETYDDSQAVGKDYSHRVSQLFNSTVDRNIRFVTITQIVLKGVSFDECADYTLMAAKEYKNKIESNGFTVGGQIVPYKYFVNKTFNHALCAVIMVMFALIICQNVLGLKKLYITICGIVLALFAFAGTYVIPDVLVNLYPTAYSAIMSCFVMTVILSYIKSVSSKLSFLPLAISVFAVVVITLLLSSIGMGVMLSGVNYYINNDIFRGIKISLLVPVAFTMLAYYLIYMKTKETKLIKSVSNVLQSEIKVYWVILAGIIGGIGIYYIIRSGNVNSISSIELAMRNKITEIFPARPRTKEFLIGYPCLLLLVYYVKHHNIKLLNWILSVGASILAASVTNSFCHVFTDYTTIVMRVVNGLIVGFFVCVFAYIGNIILVKIIETLKKRI